MKKVDILKKYFEKKKKIVLLQSVNETKSVHKCRSDVTKD